MRYKLQLQISHNPLFFFCKYYENNGVAYRLVLSVFVFNYDYSFHMQLFTGNLCLAEKLVNQ